MTAQDVCILILAAATIFNSGTIIKLVRLHREP